MRRLLLIFKMVFILGIFMMPIAAKANIIINEIMYDTPAADDGREWIEIANTGTETVDLIGWKLFENNVNHGLTVSQGSMEIAPDGFVIIADNPQKFLLDWPGFSGTLIDSAFSLSNTGEVLSIKDAQDVVVDAYTYASSIGASGNGDSQQRIIAGWVAQAPTPGEANEVILPPEEEIPPPDEPADPPSDDGEGSEESQEPPLDDLAPDDDEEEEVTELPPDDPGPADDEEIQTPPEPSGDTTIIINEIMYDASGSDDGKEWLELLNVGPISADITEWKLVENDVDHGLSLIQGPTLIGVADFAVIAEDSDVFIAEHPDFTGILFDSSFSLSNTGETLAIKDTQHVIRAEATYDASAGAVGDGRTLQHFDAGFIAALPTPGAMNVYDPDISAPENPDDDAMPSGGGETTESDNAPLIKEELALSNVIQAAVVATQESASIADPAIETLIYTIVTRDTYSFIQIENPGDVAVDISTVLITFREKSFSIPEYTTIAPKSVMVIANAKARLAGASRAVWSENEVIIE